MVYCNGVINAQADYNMIMIIQEIALCLQSRQKAYSVLCSFIDTNPQNTQLIVHRYQFNIRSAVFCALDIVKSGAVETVPIVLEATPPKHNCKLVSMIPVTCKLLSIFPDVISIIFSMIPVTC